ncbi:MAG TPA: lamin tail domain-containing protein [Hymenobacter sp.]|jgi:hypothetical protein|uniref:lamin tail domain-containing protein n=1 Tax=Hymenobacter sp. TaxID=1898978 RepID=UPI002EDA7AAF
MMHKFTSPHQHSWNLWKQLLLLLSFLAPALAQAQSTTVVISEVYGGGGTSTSVYRNDFVELYNKTGAAINLTGFSIQSASGTGNFTALSLAGEIIPANGYLLVQFGGGGNPAGALLPTPDATSGTNLGATSGRIALVNGTVPIASNLAANSPGIVDFVGYGPAADTYEGGERAPALTNSTSIERKARELSRAASMAIGGVDANQGNGYDSNNNQNDFLTRQAPQPQNSASPAEVLTPTATYYNTKNPAGALNELATYSSTPDGLGASPTSFSDAFQVFFISGITRAALTADWTVDGVGSRVILQDNASFTVPAAFDFTGTLDLRANSTLVELNADPGVTFDTQDPSSTVEFAQTSDYTVPVLASPGYGNLTLRNGTKRLGTGTTIVRSSFLVSNVGAVAGDVFRGAPGAASTLSLNGNFTLEGTVSFAADGNDRIALIATNGGTTQVLDGGGNTIKLYRLTTAAGQAALRLADGSSNLELGNALAGGGYALAANTTLTVGANTLSFFPGGQATIGSSTGVLALSPASSLAFSKNGPASLGTLRLSTGSTEVTNFTLDAAGPASNTLTLPTSLTVSGTLALTTGRLTIGAGNVLTLNGPYNVGNGSFGGSTTSDLVIAGTGAVTGNLFVAGGLGNFTFNRPGSTLPLAANLTVNSALTLANGTLGLSTFDLTLNGSVTTTGGLLSGTTASDLRINGSGPLGNIAFAPSLGVLSVLLLNRPGGTLLVEGGPLQVTSPTLTNGILSLGSNVALTITGTLVVDNPAVALFAGTPTSSLNFTGTGAIGPLAFVAGQNVLQALSLNRATGTIPTAELMTSLTVNSLTLTRGRIFAPALSTKLILTPGGSLATGAANGYTNTLTLASVTNNTTPTVNLTFPLGVDGQVRPLTFSVTDQVIGTTSYTARQYEAPSPTRTLPPTLVRVSQIRYYSVVRESGTSTLQSASIRLTYDAGSDRVTTANAGQLRVAMTDPADNTRWRDAGGFGDGAGITSLPFPDGPLGDFTLATDINTPPNTNPLPVELSRFDAARQADDVRVNWATASEKNSLRFEVQRSLDGKTFATVAMVNAQGNSTRQHEYTALDAQAPAGQLYYRLRQVDVDGTVAFSGVVTVKGTGVVRELALYPNPATERVSASLPAAEGRTFRVLNSLGQVLSQGDAAAVNPTVDVRPLPAGTYFLELRTATGRQVRRFVKNN